MHHWEALSLKTCHIQNLIQAKTLWESRYRTPSSPQSHAPPAGFLAPVTPPGTQSRPAHRETDARQEESSDTSKLSHSRQEGGRKTRRHQRPRPDSRAGCLPRTAEASRPGSRPRTRRLPLPHTCSCQPACHSRPLRAAHLPQDLPASPSPSTIHTQRESLQNSLHLFPTDSSQGQGPIHPRQGRAAFSTRRGCQCLAAMPRTWSRFSSITAPPHHHHKAFGHDTR